MSYQESLKQKLFLILEKIGREKKIDKLILKKIDFSIDISPKKDFGDLSSNIAMIGSKTLKCSPTELAEKIIFFFKDEKQMEKIEIIKPGFY